MTTETIHSSSDGQPSDCYSGFKADHTISETEILQRANEILETRFARSNFLTSPQSARDYLTLAFSNEHREVFGIVLLDNQHGVLGLKKLFYGTIDGAAVYPREVVRAALEANAAAVVLVHNHPSGHPEPSKADKLITHKIIRALSLVDIRVLDHIIVAGAETASFAERGLLS